MSSFVIETPKEFNFHQCLHFLNRSPQELLHTTNGEQVQKVIRVHGKTILFSIETDLQNQLLVHILNQRPSVALQQAVRNYVTDWFDLNTNLKPFYTLASKDPILKPLVKKYAGYRIVGMPDLFEALAWAIIGQQINLSFAYRLKKQFVQSYGEMFRWKDQTYYHFPIAEVVAGLSPDSLLALQFSKQKAAYVIATATAIATGAVSKNQLLLLSFPEAKAQLQQLKGIGNWTANYVLMKTFHYPNAFPLEDAGLHQALRKQLNLQTKPPLEQVKTLFTKYMGWEAYATLYLWRSLSE